MTDDVTPEGTDIVKPGTGNRGMGRKKGSKNKSTLLREALTNDFEAQLQTNFKAVIETVINQAINEGCRQSQKLIIDRVVPTVHAESTKDKNPFAGGISIVIGSLEQQKSVTVSPDIVDAEYEELEQETHDVS